MENQEKIILKMKTRSESEMKILLETILEIYNMDYSVLTFLKTFMLTDYFIQLNKYGFDKIKLKNDKDIIEKMGVLMIFFITYLKGAYDVLRLKLNKPKSVVNKPLFLNFFKSLINYQDIFAKSISDNKKYLSKQNILSIDKKFDYLLKLSSQEIERDREIKISLLKEKYGDNLIDTVIYKELVYMILYTNKVGDIDKSYYYRLVVYNLDNNISKEHDYFVSYDVRVTKTNINFYQKKVMISLLNFVNSIPKLNRILNICFENIDKRVVLFDGENICYDNYFRGKYDYLKRQLLLETNHIFIITLQNRRIVNVVPNSMRSQVMKEGFYVEENNGNLIIVLFCPDPQKYRGSILSSETDDYGLIYLADKLRLVFEIIPDVGCLSGRFKMEIINDIIKSYSIITCDKFRWLRGYNAPKLKELLVGGRKSQKKKDYYKKRSSKKRIIRT
jgi:hypothetical protein